MRSTRSARSSAAAICAPPSTSTRVMPGVAQRRQRRPADRRPASAPATSISVTPRSAKAWRRSRIGAVADQHPGRASRRRWRPGVAVSGVRRWLSATTRTTGVGRKPGMRQVRSGSSASTVPTPTMHRVVPAAQRVGGAARRLAGDPAAFAAARGDAAVQRGGQLQRDQRPAEADARCESRPATSSASAAQHAFLDRDAGGAQPGDALRRPPAGRDRASRSPRGRRRRRSARRCRAACGPSGSRVPA